MSQAQQQQSKRERRQRHRQNISGGVDNSETAQILNTLSEIDDLPIDPEEDEIMGQLISKLTSTANLSEEKVRSNEWVRQYILILYECLSPTEDGCHGAWRGYAHGDSAAALDPLNPADRMKFETLVSNSSDLALSRSEGAKVIEEGTRDVQESILNDQNESSGGNGLLGRLGLR